MTLSSKQIADFERDGVLVVEGVVTDADLAPLIAEYEAWIDNRARQLKAEGKISDLHEDADFTTRFARLYEQSKDVEKGMDVMHVRGHAFFEFLHNQNLLDVVEGLVGPEITCNPIQHIRAKAPSADQGSGFFNVPWHQDLGVTTPDADNSNIVTCWLALCDATVDNGCMEVLPGVAAHGLLPHRAGPGGATIAEEALPDTAPRPVPVKKGGMVFMHRLTPHRSTPNFTDRVRWSLDMRYQPTGQATGRAAWPEFVVRSESDPATILDDYDVWASRWQEALSRPGNAVHHRVM